MKFTCQNLIGGSIIWKEGYDWHRLDGPAFVNLSGPEHWWKNNQFWPDQSREWWKRDS